MHVRVGKFKSYSLKLKFHKKKKTVKKKNATVLRFTNKQKKI